MVVDVWDRGGGGGEEEAGLVRCGLIWHSHSLISIRYGPYNEWVGWYAYKEVIH